METTTLLNTLCPAYNALGFKKIEFYIFSIALLSIRKNEDPCEYELLSSIGIQYSAQRKSIHVVIIGVLIRILNSIE